MIAFEFAERSLREMWPAELSAVTEAVIPHANETVVLAKTCTMPELLKRAYYELVRSGSLGQDEGDSDAEEDDDGPAFPPRIERSDLVMLVRAREQLALQWHLAARFPPPLEEFPCPLSGQEHAKKSVQTRQEKCTKARKNHGKSWDALVRDLYIDYMYDPLCGLQQVIEVDWTKTGYCDGCVESFRASWVRKIAIAWPCTSAVAPRSASSSARAQTGCHSSSGPSRCGIPRKVGRRCSRGRFAVLRL